MPVNARAVRLPARDDAHRKLALAGQRTDGGGDGAGGDAGDLAEQATTVQTVGAQPLGDGEPHLPVRHEGVSHWVQMARRLAWQLGPKYRHLQEEADRYSCAQTSQRTRANPWPRTPYARTPHARNLSATFATTGATSRIRGRSGPRRRPAGGADDPTPTARAAMPWAVGV